jgi:hypothetical protein
MSFQVLWPPYKLGDDKSDGFLGCEWVNPRSDVHTGRRSELMLAAVGYGVASAWSGVILLGHLSRQLICVCSFLCPPHGICNFCNYRFTAQWLLYIPPGVTLTNSTFCPHRVFMCFVWISEQTAIIFLYRINWLVFITETECLLRGMDWIFKYKYN